MRLVLEMLRVSVKNSTEGYTSETWGSMSKSSGVLPESQHRLTLVFADTIAGSYRVSCCFFFTSDFITGEFGRSKSLLEIRIVIGDKNTRRSIL